MRLILHLALHLLVPLAVSRLGFPRRWKIVWLTMMSAMVIDIDHLFADPVFDPNRCSINYHPLHTYQAILIYMLLAFIPVARIFGLGLLVHIVLDGIDCIWLNLARILHQDDGDGFT